jgi:hypothetical protein
MMRSRPRKKPKVGSSPPSDDRYDKLVAVLNWWVGRDKSRPEYAAAPGYHDKIQEWFGRLDLDNQELVHTVNHCFATPWWGVDAALGYAADLPPAPEPPDVVRKAWLGK